MSARKPARQPLRLIDCAKQRREKEDRKTVAILRALTARAMRGEVTGLALCFRQPDGAEQCLYTGDYRDPSRAMNVASRMTWQLAQLQDDLL